MFTLLLESESALITLLETHIYHKIITSSSPSHDGTHPSTSHDLRFASNLPKNTISLPMVDAFFANTRPLRRSPLLRERIARFLIVFTRCCVRLVVMALPSIGRSTEQERRSGSNLRMPEWCDFSCRCASSCTARVSSRLWAMMPSDGTPRTKSSGGWSSDVVVRLKTGMVGLSRCLVASMDGMVANMGATDIIG